MTDNAEMIYLPDEVSDDEKLARIICGSSKLSRYVSFKESTGKYDVKVGIFIDTRNPMELSVNRISAISLDEAHGLGIDHRDKYQAGSTYHGFAEVLAGRCFYLSCKVKKDDYNGTQPYHANIIYPVGQKEDSRNRKMLLDIPDLSLSIPFYGKPAVGNTV